MIQLDRALAQLFPKTRLNGWVIHPIVLSLSGLHYLLPMSRGANFETIMIGSPQRLINGGEIVRRISDVISEDPFDKTKAALASCGLIE